MLYLDASLIVSALTSEKATRRTQLWLAEQPSGTLFVSWWCLTEFSSALSIKLRTGQIELDERASALGSINRLVPSVFGLVDVTADHFQTAALFADQHSTGVRAGDALHLAIAAGHALKLCTLDQQLGEAGPRLGVATQVV